MKVVKGDFEAVAVGRYIAAVLAADADIKTVAEDYLETIVQSFAAHS